MKKLLTAMVAVLGVALGIVCVGCKSMPTSDAMYTTSYAIGVATGMVANETNIDDATRKAVCEVIELVTECVPETNQTFSVAWTPIADKRVAELVSGGKLTENQGELVKKAFSVVVSGIDYIFEVRYPKAKEYKELVTASVNGFTDGFVTVFKVSGDTRDSGLAAIVDIEAYNWLKRNAK